jgi:addiction module HigA family antidote
MLKNPCHPGHVIRDNTLPAFGLSVAAAARVLHTDRLNLTKILNGERALSPEMALKLDKAFGVDAELMISAQALYDLAQAERRKEEITAPIERQTLKAAA